MAIGLTAQQAKLLNYIEVCTAEFGVCPSYEEMGAAIGIKARSGVFRLIEKLEERGHIRRLPNRARSIELCRRADDLSHIPTAALVAELARRAPPEAA